MAKFNIEVELDWMDEEGYSIDEELRERIINGVEDTLLRKATEEAVKAVDKKIAEKVLDAENTIQETVDMFISNVCAEKFEKIMIPKKANGWSTEVKYISLSEYVGIRFDQFLTEKKFDADGKLANWSSDRKLSAADLLTSKYLEKEFSSKIETMIQNAKKEVEEHIVKSLEQKLKENLAKDTIAKMNIPEVLRRLEAENVGMIE